MRTRLAFQLGLATVSVISMVGCKPEKPAETTPTGGAAGGTTPGKMDPAKKRPVGTAAGNPVVGDEILIGEYASMTGDTATFGTGTHNGIMMAIEEANAAGGIKGKKLKLVMLDDASKPEQAQTVVTKLCSDDKVIAVLGEVASTRSIRGGSICQNYGVPMISPSSTNPAVTEVGDNIFRVCFTDDFQAAVAAHYAWDAGYKKTAIFTDKKSDYSVGFAKNFTDEYTKLGGVIAGERSYQSGEVDFKSQLNAIKGTSPDCVLIPGYYSEVGTIARQAREIGLTVPLVGGDGWDSPELVKGAGTALEGCVFTDHYFSTDLKEAEIQSFIKTFNSKYQKNPDALSALGYDSAKLLIGAIGRAKTLDSAGVRAAIAETKDFAGVTGKVSIDSMGNARKSALVLQIKGNEFKVLKSYTPEQIGK